MSSCRFGGMLTIRSAIFRVASSRFGLGTFVMGDDQWPPDDDRVASDENLIAFGQITLLYNWLESVMERLFQRCAPLESRYAQLLFHQLNNRERTDLLSAFIQANEKDEKTKDALQTCVLHYDICTDNRNILMHVISDGFSEVTGTAKFTKRASKNPTRKIEFHVPISDLRLVADQMAQTIHFAFSLSTFMAFRYYPPNSRLPIQPPALPEIPPKPRKLTPYQPPEAQKGG
jgi:hypothetical protein